MNVQQIIDMVHVIRLALIHLDHFNVTAPVAMFLQTMGGHVTILMNAHQTMALAHVNRPAPTRLGHSVVDAHLVMLCKVMVTIAATLMSAAQTVNCVNICVSMNLALFTVIVMMAMC